MSAVIIRPAEPQDREQIDALVRAAFGRGDEALLVRRLVEAGDAVLELVAERAGKIRGHILFSRLRVIRDDRTSNAVALAPIAVDPEHQREGIGGRLIEEAHLRLRTAGERLSVVLGEPSYYGRFGYTHGRAAGFDSDYQSEALQALAFEEDAPTTGRLVYARAFAQL